MNALLLIDSLNSGGAQRQFVYLANILAENKFNVRILTYFESDFFISDLNPNIEVITIKGSNKIDRLFKIKSYIRKSWQDVLISFLGTPNFLANISSFKKRKWALITSERNAIENQFLGIKSKIFKYFEKNSDFLICNSQTAASLWKNYYPAYSDKIRVIYNMVPDFKHINRDDCYVPKENGKLRIIVPSRIAEQKNYQGLINNLHRLPDSILDNVKIDWYGRVDSAFENQIFSRFFEQNVKGTRIENVISFFESTKNILEKMAYYDVVALFSKHEGLPNALLEGMSLSKPIFTSNVSDYFVLVNDKNGFSYELNDFEDFKNKLKLLIGMNAEEFKKMGQESKRIAREKFSKEKYRDDWLNVIYKAIKSRKKD